MTVRENLPLLLAVAVKLSPSALPMENTVAVIVAFFWVVPLMVNVASLVLAGGAVVMLSLMGRAGMGRISVNCQVFITASRAVLSASLARRPRTCMSRVMVYPLRMVRR